MNTRSPAVFFDRDGIINRAVVRDGYPFPPSSLQEVELIPGTLASMKILKKAGFKLIGITNQPDVERGVQTREAVEAINEFILAHSPVQEIFVCYHVDSDQCDCRKPKPGLIFQAEKKYNLDLSRSWLVGDRWKDISAGRAAGLQTIFIDYGYAEPYQGLPALYNTADTFSIAPLILKGHG